MYKQIIRSFAIQSKDANIVIHNSQLQPLSISERYKHICIPKTAHISNSLMYFQSNMYVSQSELANIFSKRMHWLESNANIPLKDAKISDLIDKYNIIKQWAYERDLAIRAAEYRSRAIDKYGSEYIDVGAISIPIVEISLNKLETIKLCTNLSSV